MGRISPNELQAKACEVMLSGRSPATPRDWALCVNFWAANIAAGVAPQACLLMARIFYCPLADSTVREIALFQVGKKDDH